MLNLPKMIGLSAGGMLTYHVAAKNKKVAGIIGMTFLDHMTKVPVTIKHLAHGGHYPVEPQALTQLHDFSLQFIQQILQD